MRDPSRRLSVLILTNGASFLENIKLMLPINCKIVRSLPTEQAIEAMAENDRPSLIIIDTAALANKRAEVGQHIARLIRHFANRPIIVCMPGVTASVEEGIAALQLAQRLAFDRTNSAASYLQFEKMLRLLPAVAQDPPISQVKRPTGSPATLSGRESEVLTLVASGHPMKEIAYRLDVSYRTVAYHKYKLMKRLGLRTHAALVSYAVRRGDAPGAQRVGSLPNARIARCAAGQSK